MSSMYSPREQAADRFNYSAEAEAYRKAHGPLAGSQARGHEILDPDALAFDTCRHCGQPVILRDGQLVTMLAGNAERYGRQS